MKHFAGALSVLAVGALASPAYAADSGIEVGVVLDGFYQNRPMALSEAGKGFALGHTELSFSGAIDDLFSARLTPVLHQHEGETELELEEAFVQTSAMPAGLSVVAGRFLSQVGYLNGRHTHEDSFAQRPAIYRALLGSHYFDDGLRLNALLPTPFFWQVGIEALNGSNLSGMQHDKDAGIYTVTSKFGGDLGSAHSWQAGLSYLNNLMTELEHEEEVEEEAEEHNHSATYMAKHLYILDAVWKWAPNGNAKDKQLVLSAELLRGKDVNRYATKDEVQEGWYVSAVHRFSPQWAIGARYGEANLQLAHEDHFHEQSMEESDYSIIWSRSHFSSVKLTYMHQTARDLDDANDALILQYTMSLGAHGAHSY